MVGRTPWSATWSARVPPDPLFANEISGVVAHALLRAASSLTRRPDANPSRARQQTVPQ